MDPSSLPGASGDLAEAITDEQLSSRMRELVTALSDLGPRPQGSAGHAAARDLLSDALDSVGALPYRGNALLVPHADVANLLAVVPGRERHRRPLVLTTHYDGPPGSPAAGDNGAAVALVVALCPLLAARRLAHDVIVALLDAGDRERRPSEPHGAEVFVREQRRHDLKAAIVVDRLGHRPIPAPAPTLLAIGAECDQRLPSLVAALHTRAPYVAPVARRALARAPALDAFRDQAITSLWLTGGSAPHHRTGADLPALLDDEVLAGTARHLRSLLERLATTRLPGPFGDHATYELDRLAWQRWGEHPLVDAADLQRLVRMVLPRLEG